MIDTEKQEESLIIPDVSEALAFEPVAAVGNSKKRWGRLLPVLILLTVGVGAGMYFLLGKYQSGFGNADGDIPTIKAEEGAVKVRPASPGGMDVPNRDKLVYGRMEGGEEVPQVERLLAPAETPLPPPLPAPAAPESPKTIENIPEKAPEIPEKVIGKKETAPLIPAPLIPTPPVPTPAQVEAVKPPLPAPPPPESAMKDKGKAALAETSATGKSDNSFKVQLGAVRTPEHAHLEWERLSNKHFEFLGGMELFVTKIDLGPGKGIFYRLRAGPVSGEAAAGELCANLTARKVNCLIVRPGE